jgi:DNA-binding response OmpR family regulator
MNKTPETTDKGHILIVDDDPIVAGMLGISLGSAGHVVIEALSGEEALAQLAKQSRDQLPDIIFLDIEMGAGIDGYETCRRLHANESTRDLPVIFLSGHDDLDDRLRAYDAGGSDFMAKPFIPDEVLRKAEVAIRHKRKQKAAVADGQKSSNKTIHDLISTLGESGITLNFSRSALGSRSLHALGQLTLASMAEFGLDCHVQFRIPTETLTLTQHGPASPLEESVIGKMRSMERIFSFKSRMILNHDRVSLLVMNMPVENEDLCGRIRDHAAMILESAELAADNINLRNEINQRANDLRELADVRRMQVERLRDSYRNAQLSTRLELENMTNTIENMYIRLGLLDSQELIISDTVRSAVEKVLLSFQNASDLDQYFTEVVAGMSSELDAFTVSQESEAPLSIEYW